MGVRYEPNVISYDLSKSLGIHINRVFLPLQDIIVFLDKRCIAFHSESQSSARNKKYKKITPSQVL